MMNGAVNATRPSPESMAVLIVKDSSCLCQRCNGRAKIVSMTIQTGRLISAAEFLTSPLPRQHGRKKFGLESVAIVEQVRDGKRYRNQFRIFRTAAFGLIDEHFAGEVVHRRLPTAWCPFQPLLVNQPNEV